VHTCSSVLDEDRQSEVPNQLLSGKHVLDIETHLHLAGNGLQYQDLEEA
jgi:hypothetical protein